MRTSTRLKGNRGYTLIELVLVLMLLVLIAVAVFILAATGSQTLLRLQERQSQAADLRTGLSYIDVQVHKHDASGALSIRQDPFAGGQALVIEQMLDNRTFLTWIFIQDGYLCELFVEQGAYVSREMSSQIVRMDALELKTTGRDDLQVSLTRQAEGLSPQRASRLIYLRSGGVAP
jgi:prepilin-type N-terminal cleavage/methylation domain-containing protein